MNLSREEFFKMSDAKWYKTKKFWAAVISVVSLGLYLAVDYDMNAETQQSVIDFIMGLFG